MTNTALLRPAWTPLTIAAMVIGFMIAWPLGLAMLAYILWGDNFSFFKDKMQNAGDNFNAKADKAWSKCGAPWKAQHHRGSEYRNSRTGNVAFDDWREAEFERLAKERQKLDDMMQEFDAYSRDLRRAKDQQEFDDFLNTRHNNDTNASQDISNTKVEKPASKPKVTKKTPKRPSV